MVISLAWLATASVFVFSCFALVVPNAGNGALFILLALGATTLVGRVRPDKFIISPILRQFWLLFGVFVLPLLAVLIHQFGTGDYGAREFDRPFRLAIFFLVFCGILNIPLRQLQRLQWAWMTGMVFVCIKAWHVTDGGHLPNTGSLGFMTGIAYSNMALLIGTWILLSLGWNKTRLTIALTFLACLFSLYVTFMVKTRGTWLALPFYALFLVRYLPALKWKAKAGVLLFPVLLMVLVGVENSAVRERIYDAKSDLIAYVDGSNVDTSVGQRLELWKASLYMFKEHPLLGVGRDNFNKQLGNLAERKLVAPSIVNMPHSHNALFFSIALWGLGGMIAFFMVYAVPFIYFCRELRSTDLQIRTPAAMGIILIIGFFVYDLTDVMFFWVILNGFYVINLSVFMACILKRKREIDQLNQSGVIV